MAPTAKQAPVWGKVEQLRPDTTGHNLVVKVIEAKLVVERAARGALKPQRVAECTVGDETGIVLLTARNEQVDLTKPGAYVTLRNAKVDMFRGSMRLAVNQWGKIEPASGHSFEPKMDYNLSLVEYEFVAVPPPRKAAAAKAEGEGEEGGEAPAANGDGAEAPAEPASAEASEEAAAAEEEAAA